MVHHELLLQPVHLFQIAEDLAQMEIVLAIDEADIGQVQVGQRVCGGADHGAGEAQFEP